MSDIRLYKLQTGILKCKVHNIKMNQGAAPYEIPVPWYLITYPKGNIVIDGGTTVERATDSVGWWGGITQVYWPVFDEKDGCVNALERMGIDKESIRYVLHSHLHLDHTVATGRFPNAMHVVQRQEYEHAFTPDWFAAGGYIRNDFYRPGLKWQLLYEKDDFFDVYGDGVVWI